MYRKCFAVALIIGVFFSFTLESFSANIYQGDLYSVKEGCPMPSARASYLCEWKSGAPLHSHNADLRLPMASTTKIMTAILVAELLPLDRIVTVSKEAAGTEGSSVYLYEGEKITVEDLLYALMLESANDAASALAIEAAGSIDGFAKLMNKKAESLGLVDTMFQNPHGLDHDQHYTTAAELAKIAAYALNDPIVSRIVSTKSYKTENRVMTNHNRLLHSYEGAVGMKTGYTIRTGRCLVSAAQRNGMTLIAVTLDCKNDWNAHRNLLDWGFDNYKRTTFTKEGDFQVSLDVTGGVDCVVTGSNYKTVDFLTDIEQKEITYEIKVKKLLFAPVCKGEKVGAVDFFYGENFVCTVDLVADKNVDALPEKSGFWQRFWESIRNYFVK